MTKEELNGLLEQDFDKVKERFSKLERKVKFRNKMYTIEDIRKQYDPMEHDVMDTKKREDSRVEVGTGEKYIDAITGEEKEKTDTDVIPKNRLPMPIQKKIVLISAAFMVGERIMLDANPSSDIEKTLLQLMNKVWFDNKLDYKSKEIAKIRMSETHCAELWYDYEDPSYWNGTINQGSVRRPGMQLLSESNGDKLYPVFDQYNDLIAFGREYSLFEGDKKIEHFDVITATSFYEGKKVGGEWETTVRGNPYGAINIIYHEQPYPEWWDAQPLIERKETFTSNFADSNDQFAFPALLAEGDIQSLPAASKVGKIFQVDQGGDIKYITKDQAPESMKMELDILDKEIHAGTHTADFSFESMRNVRADSGIARKMLFLDPQMKALDNQEKYGECIQRRLNLLKRIIISFNPAQLTAAAGLTVSPKFKPFMPVDDVEHNNLLMAAYKAGMISRRTMMEQSTLVSDVEWELKQIEKEGGQNAPTQK